MKGKPLLVFVNKQDVEGALTVEEAKTALGLVAAQDVDWSHQALCHAFLMGTHARVGKESPVRR